MSENTQELLNAWLESKFVLIGLLTQCLKCCRKKKKNCLFLSLHFLLGAPWRVLSLVSLGPIVRWGLESTLNMRLM